MRKLSILTSTTALFITALLITSCSGGGGGSNDDGGGSGGGTTDTTFDGNTSPAAIDASNTEDIGKAAGESVQTADASASLPTSIAISSTANMGKVNKIVISAINTVNLPAGALVPGICESGTATSSDNMPQESGELDITITFANCVATGSGFSITLNGTSTTHFDNFNDPNAGFSISYSNFTVVDSLNNETFTINSTFACLNLSDFASCTFNSDFVGDDGITHRVSNIEITGDRNFGFDGSATFFHGTFGEVTLTITGVTYGNCGVFPDSGTINYSSSDNSSGTITFNGDCTVSGTWSNSSGSGSFPT